MSSDNNSPTDGKPGVRRSGVTVDYDANWPGGVPGTGSVPDFGSASFEGSYIDDNSGNLAKSGYAFLGWSVDPSASVPDLPVNSLPFMGFANYLPESWQEFVYASEDFTIYAVWQSTAPTFGVTYSGNGNTSGSAPTDGNSPYSSGASVTVLGNSGNLAKTGYAFLGWSTNSSDTSAQYTQGSTFNISGNTTLYAVWIVLRTVTYNGNGSTGGSAPTDGSSPYHDGSSVTVLGNSGNLAKTGYRFLGWNTNSSATTVQYVAGNTFTIDSNTILYAIWKQTFTVTYNGNGNTGGSAPSDGNSPYDTGATVTVLGNSGNLVKTNYTFLGWSTDSSASFAQYTQGQTFTINSNTTLYAVWQVIPPNTYTVTYDGNGSTSGSAPSDSNSYVQGASVTVAANSGGLAKTGHNFIGWATVSNASSPSFAVTGSNVNPSNFNMPASHVTLYAVWQIITVTVVYDGNGQTSGSAPSDGNSPYSSGSSVTVLGNSGNLVKTNYTFLGWSTDSSASFAQYIQGQTFTITQNTILYAVWGSAGGGGFDGGVINNSLEVKCKFPFFGTMEQIYAWMKAQPGSLPDYSAFLRFSDINTTNLSTDIYGIVYTDDTNTDTAAVGVNDSLFVRKDLYARGFIRSAKSILPIEKWVNNTPTNNDDDKILDVDLGSNAWPFNDIITRYGEIGSLNVPKGLFVDYIEGLTDTELLTIKPRVGQTILLDGDVQVTGSLTGNGGGGVLYDGGTINHPLNIKHEFPVFKNEEDVKEWMYPEQQDPNYVPVVPSGDLGLVFTNSVSPVKTFKTFGARVLNPADPTYIWGLDAFAMWSHLFVRGDFKVRGMVNTYEGKFVAHAGPKLIGWGREGYVDDIPPGVIPKRNPEFIIWDDELEGNIVPETWDFLIARPIGGFKYRYDWANIAANNITAHDTINASHFKSRTTQPITIHSDVDINGNLTVNGNSQVGGVGGIQAGESSTVNVGGKATRTIQFLKAFNKIPSVTFAIRDVKDVNGQYQDKHRYGRITNVTTTEFTIETYTIDHVHCIGRKGSHGTGVPAGNSPLYLKSFNVSMTDIEEVTAGAVLTMYTEEKTFYTAENYKHVAASAYFYWQAVEQTQYTVDSGPEQGQEKPR